MARNIIDIQNKILAGIAADANLVALNSPSKTAIYRLLVFVVAYAIWLLEVIFDAHKTEIDTAIYNQKSGTLRWYRSMSLAFQYGFALKVDDDIFDNINFTDDQIAASKIIKYCSVKESLESSRLIVKVANEIGDNYALLTPLQIESFNTYMKDIAYAGVKLLIVNNPADKLDLNLVVYRNPLVIDATGNNILTGGKSIELAVKKYIKNLPFDGELVLNDMIDYLRDVLGITNVHIVAANASYKDLVTNVYTPFTAINVKTIPEAGYFEITNFNNVSYVV